jgi:transcription initiation factor IIE alpha subunit
MSVLNYPLSNLQVELMKLFSTNLSDKELIELKDLLSKFYGDKAIKHADVLWDQKAFSDQDMDNWLNEKS